MYPLICGNIIHRGLMILSSSSKQPIKYLEPLSLNLNLPGTNILSLPTELKATACVEAWNSFFINDNIPKF